MAHGRPPAARWGQSSGRQSLKRTPINIRRGLVSNLGALSCFVAAGLHYSFGQDPSARTANSQLKVSLGRASARPWRRRITRAILLHVLDSRKPRWDAGAGMSRLDGPAKGLVGQTPHHRGTVITARLPRRRLGTSGGPRKRVRKSQSCPPPCVAMRTGAFVFAYPTTLAVQQPAQPAEAWGCSHDTHHLLDAPRERPPGRRPACIGQGRDDVAGTPAARDQGPCAQAGRG